MTDLSKNSLGRVFELPKHYPNDFCFGGGIPVTIKMVDWFHARPLESYGTWENAKKQLLPWLLEKPYVKPGKQYVLICEHGGCLTFRGN